MGLYVGYMALLSSIQASETTNAEGNQDNIKQL